MVEFCGWSFCYGGCGVGVVVCCGMIVEFERFRGFMGVLWRCGGERGCEEGGGLWSWFC